MVKVSAASSFWKRMLGRVSLKSERSIQEIYLLDMYCNSLRNRPIKTRLQTQHTGTEFLAQSGKLTKNCEGLLGGRLA